MRTYTYRERVLDGRFDPLRVVSALVDAMLLSDYVVYQRAGVWHVGSDPVARVVVDGSTVRGAIAGHDTVHPRHGSPWRVVGRTLDDLPISAWHAYGWVDFELAGGRGSQACSAHLMVPGIELEISDERVLIRAVDREPAGLAATIRSTTAPAGPDQDAGGPSAGVEVPTCDDGYRHKVAAAIERIARGELQKVVLSRVVEVPFPVDMCSTYVRGFRANTSARSFLLDLGGWQAAGFSPETVVEVDPSGAVSTQPLAGTRRRTGDPDRDGALRAELYADPKEVFEHALSVKLALAELEEIGRAGATHVSEFLTVKQRGSVQHLASRVATRLRPPYSAWDAFEAVFPSITASGIPKSAAYEVIAELEDEPRGLYSGAVVMAGADGMLDAALVLRSVFQRDGRSWLRAGAGVVGASVPERELEETCEKLASIAPYLTAARPAAPATPARTMARLRDAVAAMAGPRGPQPVPAAASGPASGDRDDRDAR